LFKPDLIVICFVKYAQPDKRFMEMLSETNRRIPVITVGMEMVDSTFEKLHGGGSLVNLTKRNASASILEKACDMLGISLMSMELSTEEDYSSGKPLILVVDDFALLLRQIRGMLKDSYEVEVATSGVQAMTAIGRSRPDLILLDYAMPGYDGKQIFEALKVSDETKEIPVIFLTGVSEHSKVEEIIDLKPAGYLLKPPDKDKLIEMIEAVLERQRRKLAMKKEEERENN
jgi:CheY-like chemotaxis protein